MKIRIGGKKTSDVRRTLRVSASGLFAGGSGLWRFCRRPCQNNRGQHVAEYMLLVVAISAAFMAIQIYAKRGLNARIKDLVDHEIGAQIESAPTAPFDGEVTSTSQMTSIASGNKVVSKTGQETRYDTYDSSSASGTSESVSSQMLGGVKSQQLPWNPTNPFFQNNNGGSTSYQLASSGEQTYSTL